MNYYRINDQRSTVAKIPIHPSAVGMIIGKGGATIRELSAIRGISSARIVGSELVAYGDALAIEVDAIFTKHERKTGYIPRLVINITGRDHDTRVVLEPVLHSEILNTLALCGSEYDDENEDPVESLSLSKLSISKFIPQMTQSDCATLTTFLSEMRPSELESLLIHFQVGKNQFMTPFDRYLRPYYTLPQAFKHKRQFNSNLSELKIDAFHSVAAKLGYELVEHKKTQIVHLFDFETDQVSSFYLFPEDFEDTEEDRAMKESVVKVLSSKTYYEMLEIDEDSSMCDIFDAFEKVSSKVDPETNRHYSAPLAHRIVENAFETLSSTELRFDYDKYKSMQFIDPRVLEKIITNADPPLRVFKYVTDSVRQAFVHMVSFSPDHDARITLKTRTTDNLLTSAPTQTKMRAIEKAWLERDSDGNMRIEGMNLRVKTVRFKDEEVWYRDGVHVSVFSEMNSVAEVDGFGIRLVSDDVNNAIEDAWMSGEFEGVAKEVNVLMKRGFEIVDAINSE